MQTVLIYFFTDLKEYPSRATVPLKAGRTDKHRTTPYIDHEVIIQNLDLT